MTWWQEFLASLFSRPKPPTPPSTWPPPQPPKPPPLPPAPGDPDPTGLVVRLNMERAFLGLGEVVSDADLADWAARNNRAQAARGIGHWVFPPSYLYQNSGWNYPDAPAMLAGWMMSPGHRAGLMNPFASRVGVSHDGPWWTINGA